MYVLICHQYPSLDYWIKAVLLFSSSSQVFGPLSSHLTYSSSQDRQHGTCLTTVWFSSSGTICWKNQQQLLGDISWYDAHCPRGCPIKKSSKIAVILGLKQTFSARILTHFSAKLVWKIIIWDLGPKWIEKYNNKGDDVRSYLFTVYENKHRFKFCRTISATNFWQELERGMMELTWIFIFSTFLRNTTHPLELFMS